MSYQTFSKAISGYYETHNLTSLKHEEVEALLRDAWIRDGRYKELVALASPDQFQFMDNLRPSLERFHPKEIRKFDKILLTKINELNTWELWALAYIVRGGCGDDAFDYFKAWVVSKGRKAFETIKGLEEDKLVPVFDEDPQLEELYYLAGEVYETKTSEFMPPVRVKTSKLTGKRWKEDKLAETFPSLYKLFN